MSTIAKLYPGIPEDFPVGGEPFALAGAVPKLNLVEVDGKYYPAGATPEEVMEAYAQCLKLIPKLVAYCKRKTVELEQPMDAILIRTYKGVLHEDWCTPDQSKWTMRHVATELGLQIPPELCA